MRFTIPNVLTFFRLLAAPCVGLFLILDLSATAALFIFLIASITDYLDGYLARTLNQSTSLGKVLDPIADKAMIVITLCFVHYEFDSTIAKIFFGIPAIAIIFREIFISGLREYVGGGSELLNVSKFSKWKTALQMISVGVLLASRIDYLKSTLLHEVGILLLWFAALVTVMTGINYFKKSLHDLKG